MTVLQALVAGATKRLQHLLRAPVYLDKTRQDADWTAGQEPSAQPRRQTKPIKLDFGVPKKHRLGWIQRTIRQLPHGP